MFNSKQALWLAPLAFAAFFAAALRAPAQSPRDRSRASRTAGAQPSGARAETRGAATEWLRAARTVYVAPNVYIDADYLEYKLDRLPEFGEWGLALVKERDGADLVIEIGREAPDYFFSVVEPRAAGVVVRGKVVAVNGLIAAEDISHEIVRRMKERRAAP